jgi:uncharacterized protein (DUF1778 family)
MKKVASTKTRKKSRRTGTLQIHLDARSKAVLLKAAELRSVSVSEFIRFVAVPQAKREVEGAKIV